MRAFALRILLLVPRVGARAAELIELPVMLTITYLAALARMLVAALTLVLRLRGLTIGEYCAARGPVAGAAHYGALVLPSMMPLYVNRRQAG